MGYEYKKTKVDFLYDLFESFAQDEDASNYTFDTGQVSRWLNGQQKISSRIACFYARDREKLVADIATNIVPKLYDSAMATKKVYNIFMQDSTISDKVKKRCTKGYPFTADVQEADFLADVLLFCMSRKFSKYEMRKKC